MNARKKIDLLKYKQAIDLSYSFYKDKHRKGIKIPYFAYLSSVSNLIIENNSADIGGGIYLSGSNAISKGFEWISRATAGC